MLFTEKKVTIENIEYWEYSTTDVFGTITFQYVEKVEPSLCDDVVVALLKLPHTAETIEGTIDLPKGDLHYEFKRRPQWEKINDQDDTPTETRKRGSSLLANILWTLVRPITGTYSWCKKFVAAFKEAVQKANQ